jgi:hypothetical protein
VSELGGIDPAAHHRRRRHQQRAAVPTHLPGRPGHHLAARAAIRTGDGDAAGGNAFRGNTGTRIDVEDVPKQQERRHHQQRREHGAHLCRWKPESLADWKSQGAAQRDGAEQGNDQLQAGNRALALLAPLLPAGCARVRLVRAGKLARDRAAIAMQVGVKRWRQPLLVSAIRTAQAAARGHDVDRSAAAHATSQESVGSRRRNVAHERSLKLTQLGIIGALPLPRNRGAKTKRKTRWT